MKPFIFICLTLTLAALACAAPAPQAASLPGDHPDDRQAELTDDPQPTPSPVNVSSPAIIQPTQPPISPTPQTCQVTTGIAGGRLNMRACPGLSCAVIAVLAEDDRLDVLESDPISGWLYVQAGKQAGWVYSQYLTCGGKN